MRLPGVRRRRPPDSEHVRLARRRLATVSGRSNGDSRVRGGWVPQIPPGIHSVNAAAAPEAAAVAEQEPGPPAAASDTAALRTARFGLERGHVAAIAVCALAGLAGAALLLGLGRPQTEPLGPAVAPTVLATGTPVGGVSAGPQPQQGRQTMAAPVVVHVAGKVRQPGVVRLPAGSRVLDAVAAAGGAEPGVDLTGVNLARPVTDGEQVLVGITPPAATAPGSPAANSAQPPHGLVNLNTASNEELEELPGIGPALAGRIVSWREQHGGFHSVGDLQEVAGIGPVIFAELQPLVTV